jgi:hypothetical protein
MKKADFYLVYALLTVVQMVICNYFHLTAYVMLSILPVMVLCIPTRVSTIGAMLIAFVTGLAVDLLSEGLLGLNALALVPVALARKGVVSLIFGEDLFVRHEDFSIRKHGLGKVAMAIFLVQALFLLVYIWADGAGTRPFWFNAARFGASLAAGIAVSLLVAETLAPDTRK